MLRCATPSLKQASASSAQPPSGLRQPAPVVAATPPLQPSPSRFDDLPNEIVCAIASHVFLAAVHDQKNDVASLACTPALQATLADELHANAVLRQIHAATDFACLLAALPDVEHVFPRYRQGCLLAAARLLPKLGLAHEMPDALWSRFCALMRPHAQRQDGKAEPREAVLLALIESFRSMPECNSCTARSLHASAASSRWRSSSGACRRWNRPNLRPS